MKFSKRALAEIKKRVEAAGHPETAEMVAAALALWSEAEADVASLESPWLELPNGMLAAHPAEKIRAARQTAALRLLKECHMTPASVLETANKYAAESAALDEL